MKKKIVFIVVLFTVLFTSKLALAQDGVPIITYTLNGASSNVSANPVINPVQLGFVSDEIIENWVSLKIVNVNDSSIYKTFQLSSSCDGTYQCNQLWSGEISPKDKTLIDGNYSAIVHIKNITGITFDLNLTSLYIISVSTSTPTPTLSSIAITTPATKLNYYVGDSLDISGLAVTGTYSDNSTKNETFSSADVTGFNSTVAVTDQILTVTVNGKTATYKVNINAIPSIPTENIIIRNGDTIIYSGTTPLPSAGTINISDDTGIVHAVNDDSILGVIYSLSQTSGSTFSLSDLQYYSSMGFMLKCITSLSQSKLCSNWQYVVNGTAPWDSIDTKVLSGEETVGIYFGYPYQVTFDKTSINTGESFNATAQKYNSTLGTWDTLSGVNVNATVPNPDDPWNPTVITSQSVDSNGSVTLVLQNAGTYNVSISDSLGNFYYIPTYTITVNTTTSSGGGTPSQKLFSVPNALDYLFQHQTSSPMYADWVAIAAGAGNNTNLKLSYSNYLKSNPINSPVITDSERRAMALMSLGINPYSGTGTDYIKKIIDSFDGTQFGDTSLTNDDIFALITLAKAGYTASDQIISKDVAFVLSKESSDGSWEESVDLTSATIQALSQFNSIAGVPSVLSKAGLYLQNAEGSDGGWGNISSSSWAAQAMSALCASWTKNGKTVAGYLTEAQADDGAVIPESEILENRIWETAYAIPAAMNMTWGNIMQSFPKPVIAPVNTGTGTVAPITVEAVLPVVTTPAPTPIPTLVSSLNLNSVNKIEVKKNTGTTKPKIKIKVSETSPEPFPPVLVAPQNNLGASAGSALSGTSIKKISNTVTNSIINAFTYIGKGFCDLMIYIFHF